MSYDWSDHQGNKHKRISNLNATVMLGHLFRPNTACAEMAGPEIAIPGPLLFRLDNTGYRIPIFFSQRSLPAGRISWFKVPLKVNKSSQHEFRVIVRMSDGREIASRPIKLLYYVPRVPATNSASRQTREAGAAFALPTLWEHNGSKLALEADGPNRVFYYVEPRPSLKSIGVTSGTLLFRGQRVGDRYSGKARVFTDGCEVV